MTALPEPEPWMTQAVCASVDAELFYPEKGGSVREAKKVCSGCPVAAECLTFALMAGERFGVWGGTTERQRRRMPTPRAAVHPDWERGEYPCVKCQRTFANRHGLAMHENTHLAAG